MPARIELTDNRFFVNGRSYSGVPLLVDSANSFVGPVCDYLRLRILNGQVKASSARTYAENIQHFWQFLERRQLALHDVCDNDLRVWLNEQAAAGVSAKTRAYRCDCVFNLFVWLEQHGYVDHVVHIPGLNDNTPFTPQLSSQRTRQITRNRHRLRSGMVSSLRPRYSEPLPQHTPTEKQLTQLYVVLSNAKDPHARERNGLLVDWYTQAALRRKEWVAIMVDQVPDMNTIYTLQERGEAYQMLLRTTKGDRQRYVGVLPDLLEKTREYMDGERHRIVQQFKRSSRGAYCEPNEVFLSSKTGGAMTLRAVSNILGSLFRAANIPGHGHRLRALALCRLMDAEIEAEEARMWAHPGSKSAIDYEMVLRKVAEYAGHSSLNSLRYYLQMVRKRRVRDVSINDPVNLAQQARIKQQDVAILEQQIVQLQAQLAALTSQLSTLGKQ